MSTLPDPERSGAVEISHPEIPSSPGSVGLARAHPLTKTQAMEPSRQARSSYGPPYPLGHWTSLSAIYTLCVSPGVTDGIVFLIVPSSPVHGIALLGIACILGTAYLVFICGACSLSRSLWPRSLYVSLWDEESARNCGWAGCRRVGRTVYPLSDLIIS